MKKILNSDKLKLVRAQANFTQAKLAENAGIATSQVVRYETGKAEPKLTTVIRMAQALGVEHEDLLIEIEDRFKPKALEDAIAVSGYGDARCAGYLDISLDEFLQYKNGVKIPTVSMVSKMADEFGVHYEELIGQTKPEPRFSVTLTKYQSEQIKKIAQQEGKNASQVLEDILDQYLKKFS